MKGVRMCLTCKYAGVFHVHAEAEFTQIEMVICNNEHGQHFRHILDSSHNCSLHRFIKEVHNG
jgi:hypothetical protein